MRRKTGGGTVNGYLDEERTEKKDKKHQLKPLCRGEGIHVDSVLCRLRAEEMLRKLCRRIASFTFSFGSRCHNHSHESDIIAISLCA